MPQTARRIKGLLDQPALLLGGGHKGRKQGVRGEGAALQLGVELHPDEPRVILQLDDFGQDAVG